MEIPYNNGRGNYPGRTTQGAIRAFSLGDNPTSELFRWQGYFRNTDPTVLSPNTLTFPSINCFIPNKDRIVPRLGTTLLGAPFTPDKTWPIVGHKKRFATMGGYEVEVRVVKSDDADLKDILEVLYPNPATGELQWYQVSQNVNPFPAGLHRYYFDDWFDTNLDPAVSFNLSRLIWVNGLPNIFSWTGGIAPVVSIVPNVSISTTAGVTWASLGIIDPAIGGSTFIVINGETYTPSAGWNTDTLLISDTTGISVNDVAFEAIVSNATPGGIGFDVCRNNKNYMFYGSWNSRRYFMSNAFAHPATASITAAQAVQNDLVLTNSLYTGTGSHVYRVSIDSVNPPIETQEFTPGPGGLNDGLFNATSYSGTAGLTNTYIIQVVADFTFSVTGTPAISIGETLVGDTSGAVAVLVAKITIAGNDTYGLKMLSVTPFATGENVTATNGGTTGPIFQLFGGAWYQYYKNGNRINVTDGFGSQPTNFVGSASVTLTDGLTFAWGALYGNAIGDTFKLTINQGGQDTFQWQIDGAAPVATGVPITGGNQALNNGIVIKFISQTGHTLGDYWEITVNQVISSAWANFYYTLPVRKPGEGYIYQLPSNFWAMAPQEEQMYVNTKYGYWSFVTTQLSADLQSETVSLTPLKQASSSKVLFPYMMSYLEDYIIYVTEDKKLDMIGRQKLLQLPQTRSLSQAVALDFQEASFEDGSMEYWDQRLWITSPKDNVMLCYDNQPSNKYWQPPQVIPENGILSIVGNTLISHSNIRNQTFNLFTGTSGDTENNYTVRARSPYLSYGDRWGIKNSNKSFIEGYVSGNPPMDMKVYLGVGGCGGILSHRIAPIICVIPDQAPLGEGNLGSHQNGSDIFTDNSHFNEIYTKYLPTMQFRFASIELECVATNHSYSWLSMGLNAIVANRGNIDLINKEVISPQ